MNSGTLIAIYRALFEAQLRYCITAYGSAFYSTLESITKIQNALIEKILRRRDTETLEELYEKSNIRPFKLLCLECLAVEALIRNPASIAQLVSEHVPSHSYDTRNTTSSHR